MDRGPPPSLAFLGGLRHVRPDPGDDGPARAADGDVGGDLRPELRPGIHQELAADRVGTGVVSPGEDGPAEAVLMLRLPRCEHVAIGIEPHARRPLRPLRGLVEPEVARAEARRGERCHRSRGRVDEHPAGEHVGAAPLLSLHLPHHRRDARVDEGHIGIAEIVVVAPVDPHVAGRGGTIGLEPTEEDRPAFLAFLTASRGSGAAPGEHEFPGAVQGRRGAHLIAGGGHVRERVHSRQSSATRSAAVGDVDPVGSGGPGRLPGDHEITRGIHRHGRCRLVAVRHHAGDHLAAELEPGHRERTAAVEDVVSARGPILALPCDHHVAAAVGRHVAAI